MTESCRDERAIFLTALEREAPEQREAYLAKTCAGDDRLLRRVRELLASHEGSLGPLDAAPLPIDIAPGIYQSLTALIDTQVGPYKLRQKIGEGGMGVVYLADQKEPVARRVALKVIKPGMDTQQVVARFQAERQALAIMDHPNIAKVLDAGTTETGRPYFVMELVNGQPISKYCDEQQLSPRQRLELFVQICQAVQHAHQKGIIHRDLKPSNILVALYDGQPVPKVIDFGVAKAVGHILTDKSFFTQFGQIVGTLEYMSPEQAGRNQLDVDTRSDIYSLGVILYELLTGNTPFDKQKLHSVALDEMLRVIREEEPPTPSKRISSNERMPEIAACRKMEPAKLAGLIRGELDWIVMKTLEKERARRYPSASYLAEDILRYLHNETVLACPPSAAYRFRKFALRNTSTLITVGLVFCVLAGGIIVSTWQALRARNAELVAVNALVGERRQSARAEANFLKTLQAVDEFLSEVGEEELASVPHFEPVRRRLLLKALEFFQGFLREKGTEPSIRMEAGLAYCRAGEIRRLLGSHKEALTDFEQAILLLDEKDDRYDRIVFQRELARACLGQGTTQLELGQREQAEQSLVRARTIQEDLSRNHASASETRYELARTCNRLGRLYHGDGRRLLAEKVLRQAILLLQDLLRVDPQHLGYAETLLDCLNNLGTVLRDVGNNDEAARTFEHGIQFAASMADHAKQDGNFRYVAALIEANYAMFLRRTGDTTEGHAALRRGISAIERLAQDFPHVPRYKFGVYKFHVNLGAALAADRDFTEAEPHLRKALDVMEQLTADYPAVAEYHSALGGSLNDLSVARQHQRDFASARQYLVRAITAQRKALELDPNSVAARTFLYNHVENQIVMLERSDVADTELDAAFHQALAAARWLRQHHSEAADSHYALGISLHFQAVRQQNRGELAAARRSVEEAIEALEEARRLNAGPTEYLKRLATVRQLMAELLAHSETDSSPDESP